MIELWILVRGTKAGAIEVEAFEDRNLLLTYAACDVALLTRDDQARFLDEWAVRTDDGGWMRLAARPHRTWSQPTAPPPGPKPAPRAEPLDADVTAGLVDLGFPDAKAIRAVQLARGVLGPAPTAEALLTEALRQAA